MLLNRTSFVFKHKLLTLFAILTYLSQGNSQTSFQKQMSQNENFEISNSAQCAVEMGKPAASIFISANFLQYGIVLNNLKKQLNQDKTFILNGLDFQKNKLAQLSLLIINHLKNKQLPFVANIKEAQYAINNTNLKIQDFDKTTQCTLVNNLYLSDPQIYLRNLNSENLKTLAENVLSSHEKANCLTHLKSSELELYPVFNFDLKQNLDPNWQKIGFSFWSSFKIYLSLLWKSSQFSEYNKSPYQKISLLTPIEDQIILNSDGCYSLQKPECQSDYLSSVELRTLFSTERTHKKMTSQSTQMKDSIIYGQHELEEDIFKKYSEQLNENELIRNFQNSYLGFVNQNINLLFDTSKTFSKILSKKNVSQISSDIQSEIQNPNQFENLHYMCTELRLLKQGNPVSLFKIDDQLLQENAPYLNQYIKYGMSISDILIQFDQLAQQLILQCDQVDQYQVKNNIKIESNWIDYKPWYLDILKSYKAFKDDINIEAKLQSLQGLNLIRENTYIDQICSSASDCVRIMMSQIAEIHRLSLHKNIFLKSGIISTNLFNENAEKIACNVYDPFEASRNNQKKLIADIGSSILFGWTALPVLIDIDFKSKELVSFNKLLMDKKIKFNLGFEENQIQKALAVNFGSLLNVPCSLSFSETNHPVEMSEQTYLFKGISAGLCKGKKSENSNNKSGIIDNFNKDNTGDFKTCGQCTINLASLSTFDTINAFSPFRFFIKMLNSLVRYNTVKNDNFIIPNKYSINKKYLIETYLENKHSIPEQCITMLSQGLPCRDNLCEALTQDSFERQTGLKAEKINLVNTRNYHQNQDYDMAWIKIRGTNRELPVRLHCNNATQYFRMQLTPSDRKRFSAEVNSNE